MSANKDELDVKGFSRAPTFTPEPIQKQIRQLNDCNLKIFDVINELQQIGVEGLGLAYQNLRDATKEIHIGITYLINKQTGITGVSKRQDDDTKEQSK